MENYKVNTRLLLRDWPIILLILAMFAAAIVLLPYLPDPMPIHWNIHGQVDNYGSKAFGAFMPPVLTLLIYLLFLALPVIDPKRVNYPKFAGAYRAVRIVLVLFMAGLQVVTYGSALGYPVRVDRIMPVFLGLMFIVLGNYLTQVKHNYFMGIRTPWTLADEEVWRRTHRFAGPLFVAAGVLCLVSVFFSAMIAFAVSISAILGASVVSIIYSYIVFRQKNL